ncbi:TetR/AcrR family transcriptional regulator [Psychroserpens ponticola]|uniref:TetR/AcrR family transcriptional regulator n=1 Tax=Psychroserpens ponticola TaxID=2932268 RepID=A0ABY7RW75_9FLAO|nr:TetR/AcrR family transcriptional regulator [Psychroserpens ponticola]WCO01189.1 TetR/AcrR family transcriptional regulator [Psychroserpens ponticola]
MKKLGVKERIIITASDLFYNQGFNQTGINQIISEAGVAKASMYQHFRSKEDIAVAYLTARHSMWMGKLKDCVSVQNTSKGKVIGCFDYLIEWLCEVNFRGCGWQNIITDLPKDHDKIRDQAIYHKNDLRKWIHTLLKEEGKYPKPEELGDEVLILIEGAIILSQIQKEKWPIEVAKKACIKLLI